VVEIVEVAVARAGLHNVDAAAGCEDPARVA
jgi:hypothetical protein